MVGFLRLGHMYKTSINCHSVSVTVTSLIVCEHEHHVINCYLHYIYITLRLQLLLTVLQQQSQV